jgi:hypothetical protein
MKRLALILPATLLAACASSTPKKVVIVPAVAVGQRIADSTNIRLAEGVTEYRFGRYVDPGDHLVMHEAHPVYRVEQTAGWNLRPEGTSPSRRAQAVPAAGAVTPDDAVIAEINKQRATTKVFTEEAATLNQHLVGLTEAVNQTKQIAQQQLLQQRDIAALKSRLDDVEAERAGKPAPMSTKSPAAQEENW